MADLNRHTQLFPEDSQLELRAYMQCCSMIDRHFNFPQFHNGLLFHVLLFNLSNLTEEELASLTDKRRIQYLYEDAKELMRFGFGTLDIEEMGIHLVDQLMNTLTQMNRLAGKFQCLLR